jgi:CheY-like chemotaxis protein
MNHSRQPHAQSAGPAASEEACGEGAANCPRRILVVDDNRDSAESLARLLQMFNHEAQTAYDGPSALQAVDSFHPDVIVLDIGMPGMDGYEVARRLRLQPRPARLLIIALTGYGTDADRQRCYEAGIDHHLTKPARLEALQALLAERPTPDL